MTHPLTKNLDLLTVDELQENLSKLHERLGFASRMGYFQVQDQLILLIGDYQEAYYKRLTDALTSTDDGEDPFDDILNIE